MLAFWRGVQSKYKGSIKSAVIGFHQHAHGSVALERKKVRHYSTYTSSFKADCYAVTEIITGPHTLKRVYAGYECMSVKYSV